ncbi:MAG: NAD-dependent epimerase/dehydratase family protein [Candidatus Kariarchaeaceae archaeon]|jgi:nucleoside-diphosphate-sugar epimerase
MRILVTGATGYLGLHICEYLKNLNHEVTGFIRNPKKAKPLDDMSIPYIIGDIRDLDSLIKAMSKGFDIIINNAGYIGVAGSWKSYKEVNVDGVENVAAAMVKNDIKRIIQISSIAAYGVLEVDADETVKKAKPRWFKYGVTKQEGENKLLEYPDLEITILRPGHIVGRRDRMGYVPVLYHTMKRKDGRWIKLSYVLQNLI